MNRWERGELEAAVGITLGAPALGALITGRLRELDVAIWGLSLVLVGVPLLFVVLLARAMRPWRARSPGWRWTFRAFALAEGALQVAGQGLCFTAADTDAQGAIAFLFAPLYAHVLALLGAALVGALVATARSRSS